MAFRSDVTIDFNVSPRVITVAAPSDNILLQDLVDTVRVIEDELVNLSYDHILNAAGKEDLGNGVQVGITIILQNAIIKFEDRAGPTFELMTISGGNIVAVDTDGVTPITPVDISSFTVIVLAQSSSATLLSATEMSSKIDDIHGFVDRAVHIDTEEIAVGNGYQQTPYNNFSDAVDYMELNNLRIMHMVSDATVDRQLKNFTIIGRGFPTIDLNGQNMDNTIIEQCLITGSHTGRMQATDGAIINGLSGASGVFLGFSILGTVSPAIVGILLLNDVSQAVGGVPWTLDMNGIPGAHNVRIYRSVGDFTVTNMVNASDILEIDVRGGAVTIDATCTAGTIHMSGDVDLIDNSTGTTVDISRVSADLVWNKDTTTTTSGSYGEWLRKKVLTTTKFLGLK